MNKDFEINENKVIVTDEHGHQTTRKLTYNIRKILIIENNIEEMENMIKKEKNNINEKNSKFVTHNLYLLSTIMWLILFNMNLFDGNLFAAVLNILCSLYYSTNFLTIYIDKKKTIKISNKNISRIKEEIEIEKAKLNELKMEDKKNNYNTISIKSFDKKLSTSEQIHNLKYKLNLIHDYYNNKYKYIKYYKKGILYNKLSFHLEKDIEFIEQLIIQEYPNLKVSTKNTEDKQKILTK